MANSTSRISSVYQVSYLHDIYSSCVHVRGCLLISRPPAPSYVASPHRQAAVSQNMKLAAVGHARRDSNARKTRREQVGHLRNHEVEEWYEIEGHCPSPQSCLKAGRERLRPGNDLSWSLWPASRAPHTFAHNADSTNSHPVAQMVENQRKT